MQKITYWHSRVRNLPSINHPPSEEKYAFLIIRFMSARTWTTCRRVPCLLTLSTYKNIILHFSHTCSSTSHNHTSNLHYLIKTAYKTSLINTLPYSNYLVCKFSSLLRIEIGIQLVCIHTCVTSSWLLYPQTKGKLSLILILRSC